MKRPATIETNGFSLAEVTISVAIIAAVLLPIIALLAGGSGIVADSEDRFAASGVAGGIVSQMKFSPEHRGFLIPSGQIETGEGGVAPSGEGDTALAPASAQSLIPAPEAGKISEMFLGFNRYGYLEKTLTKLQFHEGTDGDRDEVFYLVKIEVEGGESGFSPEQGAPPLYRVTLTVESPAFTSEENRSRVKLSTLLAGQE